jgi:hypothetical protein
MPHEAAASRTTNGVAPGQAGEQAATSTDPLPDRESVGAARPVSFDRLLSVAALTPAQASVLAVQLLEIAQVRGVVDGEDRVGTARGRVTLTPRGEVDAGAPPDGGIPVRDLLERLLQNARRLPTHPRPEQLVLLGQLEEAARDATLEPGIRARHLEEALTEALGSDAPRRLTGQLAALVEALAHTAPSVPDGIESLPAPGPVLPSAPRVPMPRAASSTPRSSDPAPRRAAPARRATSPSPRRSRALLPRHGRGRRMALVVLVLATVLAASGYVLLRGTGEGILNALGAGGEPTAPVTTAPAQPSKQPAKQQPQWHRPSAVPAVAPLHAGPVTGVAVQKAGSCTLGSLCPVKVTVHLRPASTTRTVSWRVGAARVCKRGVTWSPPTTMTAKPGWSTVYAHSSVRVPKGRPLALVALVTSPARAQSRPLSVAGSALRC